MKAILDKKGYSLIEVMVAVALLMLAIVGPITIAAKSMQSAQYARQQNTAFFLAQEGITIANMLRNDAGLRAYLAPGLVDSWNWVNTTALEPCFETTGCNIDFRDTSLLDNIADCSDSPSACTLLFNASSTTRAVYQLQTGTETPYTRTINFTQVGSNELLVESKVEWHASLFGSTQEIILNTSLLDIFDTD